VLDPASKRGWWACSIVGTPKINVHFRTSDPEQIFALCILWAAGGNGDQSRVIDRGYFARQATWFLKFAKSIKKPELAAVLVEKAADLHSQTDETIPPADKSPQAPDVEPRA
jgi:hypothetical protein